MYVKELKNLSGKDVNIAGGKGASLGEMYNLNINVPNGYVILSNTFQKFLKDNNIYDSINELLKKLDISDNNRIEKTSIKIKKMITDGFLDNIIESEIIRNFDMLGSSFVAVRSSATSEDSSTLAWAGQLDTYLNVTKKDLISNIKNCWASLFNSRALLYRIKNNSNNDILVAVIIQKMVDSENSGTAFSINPINNKNEIIIEAIYGLGEALVSGNVNPDTYTVNKDNISIINKRINNQTKEIKKNKWIKLKNNNKQKISDDLILELSKVVLNIEKHYGLPVDIEWAIVNEKIYILQCRPITTISSNDINKRIEYIKSLGNWTYYVTRKFNWVTETTQIYGSGKKAQEELFGFNIAMKNNMVLNGDEYYLDLDFEDNCVIFRYNFDKNDSFFENFAKKEFEVISDIIKYVKKLNKINFSKLTKEELIDITNEFNKIYIYSFAVCYTRPDGFIEIALKEELEKELKNEEEIKSVFEKISTCPNFVSLAYGEEPLDFLRLVKRSKDEDINELIEEHINKYAWIKGPVAQETTSFTKEDYLKRFEFLKQEDVDLRIKQITEIRKTNDDEYNAVIKKYKFSKNTLKLSKAMRDFILLRTYAAESSDRLFYSARQTLFKEIAKRCNIELDNLIMLDMEEILIVINNNFNIEANLLNRIKDRKYGFAILWLEGKVYRVAGHDALVLQSELANLYKTNYFEDENNIIKGTPANYGKVTGIAKLLLKYEDIYNVEKGDIIITSMTTPDYVAAMEKAKGFITDEGGITCHAAIVSREFNVPCIVGTNNATKKIKNGQIIELDAYKGIVTIIE